MWKSGLCRNFQLWKIDPTHLSQWPIKLSNWSHFMLASKWVMDTLCNFTLSFFKFYLSLLLHFPISYPCPYLKLHKNNLPYLADWEKRVAARRTVAPKGKDRTTVKSATRSRRGVPLSINNNKKESEAFLCDAARQRERECVCVSPLLSLSLWGAEREPGRASARTRRPRAAESDQLEVASWQWD